MATLPLQAIVRYPQQAQAGVSYLMTVDLAFDPQRPQDWTLHREEIAIECQVSSTLFAISPPEDPTLLLHRYGGTYGSLSFLLKAQERIGTGSIHLTIFDNGLPIGDFALAAQVIARSNAPGTPVMFAEKVERSTETPESGADQREVTYDNFDLRLTHARESYDVRVLSSPFGEAQSTFVLPFTDAEIAAFLEPAVRQSYLRSSQADSELLTPQQVGARLYDALFAGEVRDIFRRSLDETARQNKGLRIRLHLADTPELASLPWEFLYVPDLDRFLALSDQNLLVRYLALPQAQPPLARATPLSVSAPKPLSILILIAQPTDLPALDVAREWEQLSTALSDLVKGGMLKLERLAAATIEGLQRRLRVDDVHILHFIGHGFFYDERTQAGLIFEDDQGHSRQVTSEQLSRLLSDHNPLRLAFLNIDYSAQRNRIPSAVSVAQALVQQGVPAAVTLQYPISDRSTVTLAREFYRALVAGYPVDLAISEARQAYSIENEQLDWVAPILYMSSPDGILWQRNLDGKTDENQQAEAEQRQVRIQRLSALSLADPVVQQQVAQAIAQENTALIRVAASGEPFDFQVTSNDEGAYAVKDATGRLLPNLQPPLPLTETQSAPRLVHRLVHLAKFYNILELRSSDATADGLVTIELNGPMIYAPGETVQLKLTNTLTPDPANPNAPSRLLNIAVFDLTEDWSVTQIYPTSASFEPVDPGRSIDLEFQATLPEGKSEIRDVIKVFATQTTADFHWLELSALDQPSSPTRGRSLPSAPLEQLFAELTGQAFPADLRRYTPISAPQATWTTAQVELIVQQETHNPGTADSVARETTKQASAPL